jgi:dipeptidase E
MESALGGADVVVVSGGNTLFAVDRWKQTGLDKHILRAVERGVVFAGGSAGLMWLFASGHSDSADPDTYKLPMLTAAAAEGGAAAAPVAGHDWAYIRVPCLGVLPGLCCPHHDRTQSNGVLRAVDFDLMLARHRGERGICVDHWAALVISDGAYTILPLPGKAGSVVVPAGGHAADARFEPGAGLPGVWIKEWAVDASTGAGAVRAVLAPASGKLDALFRAAWEPIVEDPRVEACRAGNPSAPA